MLIYHPAYDAYHCVFRLLVITERIKTLDFQKMRIVDYYFCFPSDLQRVKLPQAHTYAKKLAKAAQNEYHDPVSSARAFRELEHIQYSAARLLAASGVLNAEQLELGVVVRSAADIPSDLTSRIEIALSNQDELREYILTKFTEIPLMGDGGLKQRTGLMEYRYDTK